MRFSELTADQKNLAHQVMQDVLAPFRQIDVQESMKEMLDDLKTETDWVRNYVIEKWTNVIKAFDIDGFRVDAIKHVRVGDMATMTDAWRRAAASVGKQNFYMFGEAYSASHGATISVALKK